MDWRRDGGEIGHDYHVTAGQQYVQVNAYRNIWEVKDVFNLSDDIAHARLARVDEPSIMKTVSCISLAEGTFFELVPGEGGDGAMIDDRVARDAGGELGGPINARWRENIDTLPLRLKSQFFRRWLRS